MHTVGRLSLTSSLAATAASQRQRRPSLPPAAARRFRPPCAAAAGSNGGPMAGDEQPSTSAPAGAAEPAGHASGRVHQPRRRAFATLLAHSEDYIDDPYGATMPPLYQTATFRQPGPIEMGGWAAAPLLLCRAAEAPASFALARGREPAFTSPEILS